MTNSSITATNWMKFVNDELKLCQISIPGTHNSCAYKCNIFAKCQKISIKKQLNCGVRFFDLRFRHIDDTFKPHHGISHLNIDFHLDILHEFTDFLKSYPSETLIVLVSSEHVPKNNKIPFDKLFLDKIKEHENYWHLDEDCPKLKECRGKIVLLRRFKSAHRPFGIDMSGWRDNQSFCMHNHSNFCFEIQDEYKLKWNAKWDAVRKFFEKANLEKNKKSTTSHVHKWYLNYTSATNWPFNPPIYIAWRVNNLIDEYIKNKVNEQENLHLGLVVLDYAHEDVVKQIYSSNFLDNKI